MRHSDLFKDQDFWIGFAVGFGVTLVFLGGVLLGSIWAIP